MEELENMNEKELDQLALKILPLVKILRSNLIKEAIMIVEYCGKVASEELERRGKNAITLKGFREYHQIIIEALQDLAEAKSNIEAKKEGQKSESD